MNEIPTGQQILQAIKELELETISVSLLRQHFNILRNDEKELKKVLKTLTFKNRLRKVKKGLYTTRMREKPQLVIKSPNSLITGRIIRKGNRFFLKPGDSPEAQPLYVAKKNLAGAREDDLVNARILSRSRKGDRYDIQVVGVLAGADNFNEVTAAFYKENGLNTLYPKDAQAEAFSFPEPCPGQFPDRVDLRAERVIAIDPLGARDHDDAVSLVKLENGGFQLCVHIADVSQYVPLSSCINNEARIRAFTRYLPWEAIPMLPERLSSDLCSLRENQDRLALSCIMDVNAHGEVTGFKFQETIVRVARYYSYEEAQEMMEKGDVFLRLLAGFAKILRRKRYDEGIMDFSFPEPEVILGKGRVPEKIVLSERVEAYQWIEECMLAANRCTAKFLFKNQLPGLYRVHEPPEAEDLESILGLVQIKANKIIGGAKGKKRQGLIRDLYVKILNDTNEPLPEAVQRKVLQSMKKALYSTSCKGHFALGWQYYTHFTSPIRRYADLWNHRLIKMSLMGKRIPASLKNEAQMVGEAISETELSIMKLERKSRRCAMAWILRNSLGQVFEGTINGMDNFGMWVLLHNDWIYGDGFMPLSSLKDDYYNYDENTGKMVGRRRGRVFLLGDKVRVRLIKADPIMGYVDLGYEGL